jgi:hypothetical protein
MHNADRCCRFDTKKEKPRKASLFANCNAFFIASKGSVFHRRAQLY